MQESPEGTLTQSNPLNILIIDDEANIRKTLSICLESEGHRVTAVGNPRDALAEVERHAFDLAFVDIRLGSENGIDLIQELLRVSPWLKIVMITAYASVETAVQAMRAGAMDYLPKPFKPDQVILATERVMLMRGMEQRITILQEELKQLHPELSYQTTHPGMRRAIETARQASQSDAIILLKGASGTGKSVLARTLHSWSPRASKPFVTVSCPSLPPELVESELFGHVKGAFTGALRDNLGRVAACNGGTLFLDEIGDLPLSVQPKLLRFIQEREYERVGDHLTRKADVRIIAATNINLEQAVAQKHFREDLFYRLNVIPVEIPPLSDRPDDTEHLATAMLIFFGKQNHKPLLRFTAEALLAVRQYTWPGNIRELRNVIERAAILSSCDSIGVEHLPECISPRSAPVQLGDSVALAKIEETHIRRVLAASNSLQDAADILGIDQATLWRKRKTYSI